MLSIVLFKSFCGYYLRAGSYCFSGPTVNSFVDEEITVLLVVSLSAIFSTRLYRSDGETRGQICVPFGMNVTVANK